MTIKTILFGLEGVLIDSAEFTKGAYARVFREFRLPGDPAAIPTTGITAREAYDKASPDKDQIDELIMAHEDFQAKNMDLLRICDNVPDVLAHFANRLIGRALITNRGPGTLAIVKHCRLDRRINYFMISEGTKHDATYPESILKALAYFGTAPEEAVFVGNVPIDIRTGKEAGVRTVAINTGDCRAELLKENPDHIISDLKELIPLTQQ